MDDIVCLGLTHKVRCFPCSRSLGARSKTLTFTVQDDGSATESWNLNVDPEELLKTMEREAPGWHPAVSAILRTAPKGSIIHWKLMWRDLSDTWTSPAGRVVQVRR